MAFRRSGVLRVNSIAELFYLAEVLGKQPRPEGPRLTILTNAGGPGVLATDALITNGGELAALSKETMDAFNELLPAAWSHNNPVDILGDASPERYSKALEIAAKDPNSDGILVILTPQAMTDPTKTAEAMAPYATSLGKPVIATWMGGNDVAAGELLLNRMNVPTFPYPDTAARVFDYMAHYSENLRSLYETPMPTSSGAEGEISRQKAASIIEAARASGRTILTEYESKQLLASYGIPTVDTRIARSPAEAVKAAQAIGFPVVLKLHSETITHKTDVGGVQLNLADEAAVEAAYKGIEKSVREKAGEGHFLGVTVQPMFKLEGYELILGSSIDPQFGPVLLFGLGGQLVEVVQGPRPGHPAPDDHPGAPHDGTDQDLQGAQGRARPQVRGPARVGDPAGALQPAGHRAALDQGAGHQPAGGRARETAGAGRARSCSSTPAPRNPNCPSSPSGRTPPSMSAPGRPRTGPKSPCGPSARRTRTCWSSSTRCCPTAPSNCATCTP